MQKNIAILSSGSGSSSKKLLENINITINSNVNVIITNNSNATIIDLAKKYKIPYIYLPKKKVFQIMIMICNY
jgi:folate-dependent phosphoribosylglycinamide formyltransferase PurN